MAQRSNIPKELLEAILRSDLKVVDLTHTLTSQAPYWPTGEIQSPFRANITDTYQRDGSYARELAIPEHFGTHMDAPAHFDPKGKYLDQVPVGNFITEAVVIDVSAAARSHSDYQLTIEDIEDWQATHGQVPSGSLVLLDTGWASRWTSQEAFVNADEEGTMHYPGYSLEAARYLVQHAHPVGLGIDTPSIDYGPSKKCEVHHLTMSAGLYHLENVANLEKVPARGAVVIALPMKLEGGSGSPTRVVALVPAEH